MDNEPELTPYERALAWTARNEAAQRERALRNRDIPVEANAIPERAAAIEWMNRNNREQREKARKFYDDDNLPNDEAEPKSKFWGNQDPRDPPARSAISVFGGKTRRRYKKKSRRGNKKSRRGNKKSRRGRK
jgi:hypothetical protein